MNFRPRKRSSPEIILLPLIDVMLVLLIFFMVTTTFNQTTGLNINLPQANSEHIETSKDEVITLLIDPEGNYFIAAKEPDSDKIVNKKLTDLKEELKQIISTTNSEVPFVISADGKTPHQAVIKALDVASKTGFKHIAFATKEPDSER